VSASDGDLSMLSRYRIIGMLACAVLFMSSFADLPGVENVNSDEKNVHDCMWITCDWSVETQRVNFAGDGCLHMLSG